MDMERYGFQIINLEWLVPCISNRKTSEQLFLLILIHGAADCIAALSNIFCLEDQIFHIHIVINHLV